jgi:PAS domain S-box-containing protein
MQHKMMNSFGSSWLKNVFNTKNQDLDESIYRTIINILEFPAILASLSQNKILLSNSEFSKLTAYTQQELLNLPLNSLINVTQIQEIPVDAPFYFELIGHKQKNIGVYLKKKNIDSSGDLVVIYLAHEQVYREDQKIWQDKVFQTTQQLIRLIEEENLSIALNKAVRLISRFFETDYVMVYQVRSEKPVLEKKYFNIKESVFPEKLNSSEIILDTPVKLWMPGQAVQSELQKIARAKGFSYLVSTALGPGNTASAFLVIANTINPPGKSFQEILEIFRSSLSTLFQYFILVSTLRRQLIQHKGREAVYEKMLHHTFDGLILINEKLEILSINPKAEQMLGYAQSDAKGQPLENIFVTPDHLAVLKNALVGIKDAYQFGRINVHMRNGDTCFVDAKFVPVFQNDQVTSYIIFIKDLNELEEVRARAEQLEKHAKLGEVTAVFAHDVRNPINNISMGVQLLARKYGNDEQTKDISYRMLQDCDRLTTLMESVLAYSKPLNTQFEETNLGFLLDRVIGRLKQKILKNGITEFIQKPEKIPVIMADSRSLDQVFTNLISNAIEAMGTNNGGTLAVHIEESNEIKNHPQVVVKIIDSGPGIPEEVRGQVFEPFVTTKKSGTGLGLAICKRIVTAHRGNITVNSFPGGTVFSVFLPIKQGE